MEEAKKDQRLTLPTNSQSIHIFHGHSKSVTSLKPIPQTSYFISGSTDGKLKIWCYEKLTQIYSFDILLDSQVAASPLPGDLLNVKLISEDIYVMIFKTSVEIGKISHLVQSNFVTSQKIISMGKCPENVTDMI